MFQLFRASGKRPKREPITLEEVETAFSEHFPHLPLNEHANLKAEAAAIHGELQGKEFENDKSPRMTFVIDEVRSVLNHRQEARDLARAQQVEEDPALTSNGLEVVRYVAENPGKRFKLSCEQQANGLTLTTTIQNIEGPLVVVARLSGGVIGEDGVEIGVDGSVKLSVELSHNSVRFEDLTGNERFARSNPLSDAHSLMMGRSKADVESTVHRKGLGRFVCNLANVVIRQIADHGAKITGMAYDSDDEEKLLAKPLGALEKSANRQRRVMFWKNAGVQMPEDSESAYVSGAQGFALFSGTVAQLRVRNDVGAKIYGSFDMFPSLAAFTGEVHLSPAVTSDSAEP